MLEAAHQQAKPHSFEALKTDVFQVFGHHHSVRAKVTCWIQKMSTVNSEEVGRKEKGVTFFGNLGKIPVAINKPYLTHPHLFKKFRVV